jgi:F-type H+-transporting ATPase subunit a
VLTPLEQFELEILCRIVIPGWLDISITNATLYFVISITITLSLLIYGARGSRLIPTRLQLITEMVVVGIANLMSQQAGTRSLKYLPLFVSIFVIVVASNVIGLIPFAFTPTSHLIVTFFIAISCNLSLLLLGIFENGVYFFKLFVPKGGPLWLMPLIIVIEMVSYLLRTFSLSIRLFANMMAGHTLLHILSSFTVSCLAYTPSLAVFPFILVIACVVLELGIAFLQAYVFMVLLSIYLNDALNPQH